MGKRRALKVLDLVSQLGKANIVAIKPGPDDGDGSPRVGEVSPDQVPVVWVAEAVSPVPQGLHGLVVAISVQRKRVPTVGGLIMRGAPALDLELGQEAVQREALFKAFGTFLLVEEKHIDGARHIHVVGVLR